MSDRQARSQSFGAWAGEYDRFRPGYPDALIGQVLDLAPPRDPLRAIDLGAGTGLMSRGLLAHGAEVIGVEPDPRMLAALARVLGADRALPGSAEQIPLPDRSAEAVVGAQMWHWVDPVVAASQARRVLVPDGILALLWNVRDDRVAWVAELQAELGFTDAYREFIDGDFPDLGSGFRREAVLEQRFDMPMDPVRLAGLLGTYSPLRARHTQVEIDHLVRSFVADRPELRGQFGMPFRCLAYVARRA